LCFFEPAWPFYLKFNLFKTIYFLKCIWILYVLCKYQGMFKVLQWNGVKIILVYLTSIINFNYSIPFSIFYNTTKRKELLSLKETTFVYVLSSDLWISSLTPVQPFYIQSFRSHYAPLSIQSCRSRYAPLSIQSCRAPLYIVERGGNNNSG
jgi:hypothetical protein